MRPGCSILPFLIMGLTVAPAGPVSAADETPQPARQACTEDDEGKDGLCGHALAARSRLESERDMWPVMREGRNGTDVTHCFLDIEVTLSPNTVSGSNTLEVTSLSDGLTEITLDLLSDLTVVSVWVNGSGASYSRPEDRIVIELDQAYDTGDTFQVQVEYYGTPYILSPAAGYSGTHGSPPKAVVSSHSQPYNSPAWWPCKDAIDDKFTMDMWVTAPDWMVVASNGTLQGTDTLSGARKRTRWQENYPISVYLVSIAMTNYATWTEWYDHAAGSMPVQFYIYPEDVYWVQPLVADLVTMIETLSAPTCFGEYPFIDEKYGIAQDEGCCGMEHQTISTQGSFPERRNVHELAHMWWGDAITCQTWHDLWLNEGFARYAESLWHERKPGGSQAAYMNHMQTYRPSSYGGTVYRYDISTSGAIFSITNAYNKGSWVMHMLRWVLGDEMFFDALAAYRAAYEGASASTREFQAIVEDVYGRDLDWFFEEWIFQAGAPYYRYGWTSRDSGPQHLVMLHVEQYQTSYRNFKMPLEVTLTLATGASERHVVWHEHDIQWYVLETSAAVTAVELDREEWILRGAADHVPYEPGCNDPFADATGDGVVDLRDVRLLQDCFTGAGGTGVQDPVLCGCLDRDVDGDVDADDFAEFTACLGGPSSPADSACDEPPVVVLFADDLDADTSADWTINVSGPDTAVTFAYDYSADGIPPAPHSSDGSSVGVKFQANMTSPGATEGITLSPTGGQFSGDFRLRFDMWVNANGPFPSGGTGGTEFVTGGIGSDGATVNLHSASGAGAWFAADGEGGSSRDYRAYKASSEQSVASGQYHVDTNNNSGQTLSGYFSPQLPPQEQQAAYSQQSGALSAGCAGFAWHTVEISVDASAGTARWTIDGLDIATLDSNVGASFPIAGNIAVGYMDPYTSVSDNADLSFGIIDNVLVTQE